MVGFLLESLVELLWGLHDGSIHTVSTGPPTLAQYFFGRHFLGRWFCPPHTFGASILGPQGGKCLDKISFGHGIMSTFAGAYVDRTCTRLNPSTARKGRSDVSGHGFQVIPTLNPCEPNG